MRYERRRLARALSLPHPSLPQGGPQVLGADLNCSESRVRRVELELATSAARKPRLRRARAVADAAAAGGAVKQPHPRNARSYGSADGQAPRAVGHQPPGTRAHSPSSPTGSPRGTPPPPKTLPSPPPLRPSPPP